LLRSRYASHAANGTLIRPSHQTIGFGSARIVEHEEFARLMKDHRADGGDLWQDPILERILNSDPPILERWVMVTVDEAFIHCSKHIPMMRKVELEREWGTDDVKAKGGDYFGAASGRK